MDMGFHRRARSASQGKGRTAEFAVLLAGLAARQATTPTARAVAGTTDSSDVLESLLPEIGIFAAEIVPQPASGVAVSFHPAVSAVLLSTRQQS
jgi:hypothetical protein